MEVRERMFLFFVGKTNADVKISKLLPHQLANQTRAPPWADFSFCSSAYGVLATVSSCCSPPKGRFLRVTHPFATGNTTSHSTCPPPPPRLTAAAGTELAWASSSSPVMTAQLVLLLFQFTLVSQACKFKEVYCIDLNQVVCLPAVMS